MRANLRYAEIMARLHPTKLQMLAWGSRRPRTPSTHATAVTGPAP